VPAVRDGKIIRPCAEPGLFPAPQRIVRQDSLHQRIDLGSEKMEFGSLGRLILAVEIQQGSPHEFRYGTCRASTDARCNEDGWAHVTKKRPDLRAKRPNRPRAGEARQQNHSSDGQFRSVHHRHEKWTRRPRPGDGFMSEYLQSRGSSVEQARKEFVRRE
jgi:hypothetical protein